MRLVLLSLVLFGPSVVSEPVIGTSSADHVRLDPIVVGVSIPDAHKLAWREHRKAWQECETCFFQQEFPGEG